MSRLPDGRREDTVSTNAAPPRSGAHTSPHILADDMVQMR